MKNFEQFLNENMDTEEFEVDIEEVDEKAQIIAEIIAIETNDPLADKLDLGEGAKKLVDLIKEKIYDKLDDIEIEDLKIMKQLSVMEIEKRKLIADNFEAIQQVSQMLQAIIKEITENDELMDELDL